MLQEAFSSSRSICCFLILSFQMSSHVFPFLLCCIYLDFWTEFHVHDLGLDFTLIHWRSKFPTLDSLVCMSMQEVVSWRLLCASGSIIIPLPTELQLSFYLTVSVPIFGLSDTPPFWHTKSSRCFTHRTSTRHTGSTREEIRLLLYFYFLFVLIRHLQYADIEWKVKAPDEFEFLP